MTLNLTPVSYLVSGFVIYYLVLYAASLRRRPQPTLGRHERSPLVVLVVPACDEELVIENTLRNLCSLEAPGELRVIVMDDASEDQTARIVSSWAQANPRVRLVSRQRPHARCGKGVALNHAFQLLLEWHGLNDPFLANEPLEDIVVGIVDADGCLDPDTLARVLPYFSDPSVGQAQIGVSIANSPDAILPRLQDIEFVGFSGLVQVARDYVGSAGLGGNGQFTRMAALLSVGSNPWTAGSLTEDLELGLRLVSRGWRTRFCPGVFVHQQGLTRVRPLLRQRTRWIQGHYQCWRYIPSLWRAKGAPVVGRLDLMLYLLLVTNIVAVFTLGLVSVLAYSLDVPVVDHSLDFITDDGTHRLVTFLLCAGPLLTTMATYQRLSPHRLKFWEIPAYSLMFTLFSYLVWVTATFRAWGRMLRRRSGWVKTPRVAGATAGVPTGVTG
jgi:1,2-diacylglycerol 3-beta-glucosyltransferase